MGVRLSLTVEIMVPYVSNNNRGLKLLVLVRWAPSALDSGISEHKGKNCRRYVAGECLVGPVCRRILPRTQRGSWPIPRRELTVERLRLMLLEL